MRRREAAGERFRESCKSQTRKGKKKPVDGGDAAGLVVVVVVEVVEVEVVVLGF